MPEREALESAGTETDLNWLVRSAPDAWDVADRQIFRVTLKHGDQRVIIDVTDNKARWEVLEEQEVPASWATDQTDRREGGTAVVERWLQCDSDENDHICELVLGRLLRLEDCR